MAHPLHGTRPLAEKQMKGCDWGKASGLFFFKLERTIKNRRYVNAEVGRFVASARKGENDRFTPGPDAVAVAQKHPGWELVFA